MPTDTPDVLPCVTDGLAMGMMLGEGANGRVQLASHDLLGRDVAVKRLKHGADTAMRRALLHEGRTMGSLEHPNIVPVHAIGVDDDGTPALVMKCVQGGYWQPDDRDLAENLQILLEVSDAVVFAHEHGMVHRDIKPANVMISERGEVYLGDWGLAVPQDVIASPAGTPHFMAPEMFRASPAHGSMDVYLLGAVLHVLLTGRPRNTGQTLSECRGTAGVSVSLEGEPELVSLVVEACDADPEKRPSALAFFHAVQAWLSSRGAVQLALAARERATRLGASEAPELTDLTECLFGFRQALAQRPGHRPYEQELAAVLALAVRDAIERDVRLEMADAWLDELERLGTDSSILREAVGTSRARVARRDGLAFDADYHLDYQDRFRAYALWMGAFGTLTSVSMLFGLDHESHVGSLMVAWFFLGTLGAVSVLRWQVLTRNHTNRALLGALAFMGVLLVGNRAACGWLNVPVAGMHAIDAVLLGTCTFTLGLTHGTVTLGLGASMLSALVLIALAPTGWSWLAFVTGVAAVPVAFFAASKRVSSSSVRGG